MLKQSFNGFMQVCLVLCGGLVAFADQNQPFAGSPGWAESQAQRLEWFKDAKFGMFIHWGLYAPAGGYWPPDPQKGRRYPQHYSEWIRHWAKVPEPEYGRLTKPLFRPDRDCTKAWAALAKDAGMKYAVLTSKHHDGYTLFNAKTPYSVSNPVTGSTNISPKGRDLVGEYAQSMRDQGLKVGYYYSLIDWQHPDAYPHSRPWPLGANPQPKRYLDYLRSHLNQLFTDYGRSDILWVDYSSAQYQGATWDTRRILNELRAKQAHVIINNRFWDGLENNKGDFFTPEKYVPPTGYPDRTFEVCHTLNESFGYSYHDQNWKSGKEVVHLLVDIVSKGGNLLLNVGPDAQGQIPLAAAEALRETGRWLDLYGEAIYGTTASPFPRLPFAGRCTVKALQGGDSVLYLHVFEWPGSQSLELQGLENQVISARLLGPGQSLNYVSKGGKLLLTLPESAPNEIANVVALKLRGKPEVKPQRVAAQGTDRRVKLTADDAFLRGPSIRLSPGSLNKPFTHVEYWTDTKAHVLLPFTVHSPGRSQAGGSVTHEAGRYQVVVELAVKPGNGGLLRLSTGQGQILETELPVTGGWLDFKRVQLGEVELAAAGPNFVLLEALEIRGVGFMNFKSLELVPVE